MFLHTPGGDLFVDAASGRFAPIAVACWSFSFSQKPTFRRSRHIASRCGAGNEPAASDDIPRLQRFSIGPNKPIPDCATIASEHRRQPFAVEVCALHEFVV